MSSFQRLKEWYILGVGRGVLFREVSSVQECPHRERGSTIVIYLSLCSPTMQPPRDWGEGGREDDFTVSCTVPSGSIAMEKVREIHN